MWWLAASFSVFLKLVQQFSGVRPSTPIVLWAFILRDAAAAAPGIIPMFKARRRGKRSGTCLVCFFVTEELSSSQIFPADVALYLIGWY